MDASTAEILAELDGVTPKALTECLRHLERNGIVPRRIVDTPPMAVEYAITPGPSTTCPTSGGLSRSSTGARASEPA